MSGNPDDERLDELRQERLQELQEQADGQQQQQANEEAQQAAEDRAQAQKDAILRQYLTDGARQRLNAVQMSKPDFAEQVEQQLVALAQSGRIQSKIDEQQMKQLLKELQPDKKSFNIRRR
ncbi:DNA-binding protein [Haloprofundus marisrubri]|uniref:DNA-binding protein AUR64_13975 n=1 Tax=Haloprofundus marisrubri TaxID=1514971 RepID=A0A0W1R733_9EURY|nr:DNA-binding protein [Haloprofundus marisrubri]KTG08914.1 DNA-binding protein [Haloprofundus marisrubri]